MTEQQAERVANIVLGVAASVAAYYVITDPRVRRTAWGFLRTALFSVGPAWIVAETRQAWAASAHSGSSPASNHDLRHPAQGI